MFAYLIGRIADISEDNLVLEVNNIGFNVKIPSGIHGLLPGLGEEVKIHTYTCVREDSFQLYGFLTKDDLDMFRLLITVNGIGPKGGLAVLSVLSADDIRMAVLSQDAKTIARAPGIGAKTAQKVILDLKDKVSLEDTFVAKESAAYTESLSGLTESRNEAVEDVYKRQGDGRRASEDFYRSGSDCQHTYLRPLPWRIYGGSRRRREVCVHNEP